MSVPVAMIAAVAANGVIGADNAMPWRLPTDFVWFKSQTMGKPLIMGRKTFEGLGKPLAGRVNIVVTRQKFYQPDGVIVIDSLDAALDHAQEIAKADGANEVMIGGGAEIYQLAMPHADLLYITHIALSPEGDAHFPQIDPKQWAGTMMPDIVPTARDSATFSVALYRRRGQTAH